MRNVGIIVTAPGSIMVASTSANRAPRPRKRKNAKPHATSALDTVTRPAASTVTTTVFPSHSASGASCQTVT